MTLEEAVAETRAKGQQS